LAARRRFTQSSLWLQRSVFEESAQALACTVHAFRVVRATRVRLRCWTYEIKSLIEPSREVRVREPLDDSLHRVFRLMRTSLRRQTLLKEEAGRAKYRRRVFDERLIDARRNEHQCAAAGSQ
jgi:hypothetical protein